jgi:hypothetical protein
MTPQGKNSLTYPHNNTSLTPTKVLAQVAAAVGMRNHLHTLNNPCQTKVTVKCQAARVGMDVVSLLQPQGGTNPSPKITGTEMVIQAIKDSHAATAGLNQNMHKIPRGREGGCCTHITFAKQAC